VLSSPTFEIIKKIRHEKRAIAGLVIIGVFTILAIFAPLFTSYKPDHAVAAPYSPPSAKNWLGTDNLGQDVMSQLIYGARVSLLVGLVVALAATFIGTIVGVLSGFYRGATDQGLMRFTDVMLVLPQLPLMIILAAYLGPSVQSIIIVLTLTSWPLVARIIRSQTLSLRERPFADASRVVGSSNSRIIFRVIIPNLLTLIAANVVLMITTAVVGEAGLDFLGLGNPSVVSWGTMLYWAQAYALFNGAWWWVLAPGLCIALLGLGAVLVSLSIENVFNPRLRSR
jgi:peptide/nickel transport system permease protein